MSEHYVADDLIIPSLEFGDSCEINLDIYDDHISLTIGARDMQWKRGCPDVDSAGTMMGGVPFDPDMLPTDIPIDGDKG